MGLQFDAVFADGVLRPLQHLDLKENECVTVEVVDHNAGTVRPALAYLERVRAQVASEPPPPSLEEVQERLSKIPGSMAELIIEEREERLFLG